MLLQEWQTLVPISQLHPGNPDTHRTFFEVDVGERITHLRLNIYPG